MAVSDAPLKAQAPPPPAAEENVPAMLAAEDLKELLAPIALYPDALIALILPASTVPSDIVLAARYLDANGDTNALDNQPWDDSVKSLARYTDVLGWMDENLEWTASVGEAFVVQPADVMNSIQQLRAEARAAGNLVDTPQQTVVVEEETIRIVPADPEVIYIPQYDPEIVYVQEYSPGYEPLLTFGAGLVVGWWLNYDFDWERRRFCRGDWRGWKDRSDWYERRGERRRDRDDDYVVNITNVNQWQPSERSRRQIAQRQRDDGGNARIARARAQVARDTGAAASPAETSVVQQAVNVPKPGRLDRSQAAGPESRQRRQALDANVPPQPSGEERVAPGAKSDRIGGDRKSSEPAAERQQAAPGEGARQQAEERQKKIKPSPAPAVDRPAVPSESRESPKESKKSSSSEAKREQKQTAPSQAPRSESQAVKPEKKQQQPSAPAQREPKKQRPDSAPAEPKKQPKSQPPAKPQKQEQRQQPQKQEQRQQAKPQQQREPQQQKQKQPKSEPQRESRASSPTQEKKASGPANPKKGGGDGGGKKSDGEGKKQKD